MADAIAEKRRHFRFTMSYPVKLYNQSSQELTASQTINLSRGGALLAAPLGAHDLLGETLNVTVALPEGSYRSDQATDFACQAQVMRQEAHTDDHLGLIALQFDRPMQLAN